MLFGGYPLKQVVYFSTLVVSAYCVCRCLLCGCAAGLLCCCDFAFVVLLFRCVVLFDVCVVTCMVVWLCCCVVLWFCREVDALLCFCVLCRVHSSRSRTGSGIDGSSSCSSSSSSVSSISGSDEGVVVLVST